MATRRSAKKNRKPQPDTIREELEAAGDRSLAKEQRDKKNYAERFSRALAQRFADALRDDFPGILPDEHGDRHESKVRSAKGFKKLDVNYSTAELGLGLGLSIKTINFRDAATKRYTKNYTRADGELRAEASDYHVRQPYAVMIALVFLPLDSCNDGGRNAPSSFGQAVQVFRFRAGRDEPDDEAMLFEGVFIGLYETADDNFGRVSFFDVRDAPPKHGRPKNALSFDQAIEAIEDIYNRRNSPKFEWADTAAEVVTSPVVEENEDDEEA
ncbi:hypothetical protein SAMN05444161_5301 [Rhizobiales bacterium GAS191]|nr:hypothetical protein SAMN05444161_5301 [Rhizobiales bacterium GAS191]